MLLFKNNKYLKKGVTKRRSLVKAITWRTIGSLDTIIISYLLTGHLNIAISIGSIEVITKTILYFFHERVWNTVNWGIREKPA